MKGMIKYKWILTLFTAILLWVNLSDSICQTQTPSLKTGEEILKGGMAATAHPLATQAACEILKMGGNAVDAAVAAAFAIGVVEPDGSGIGGGGAMVVYLAKDKKSHVINYYPKASETVEQSDFRWDEDKKNVKSVIVPGTVAGLIKALEEFGALPLKTVMAPAIKYAEEGFTIDKVLASIILDNNELLSQYEKTASVFTKDGFPLMEGDTLVQKDLAATLRMIAENGRNAFYDSNITELMVNDIVNAGGKISRNDFKNYMAEITEPVTGNYRGYELVTVPPPQSGISVIEALNILEMKDLKTMGHFSTSSESAHLLAETLRRVYADRTAYLGDPDFVNVPTTGLISKEYAEDRFNSIDENYMNPSQYRLTKAGNPAGFNTESDAKTKKKTEKKKLFSEDEDDSGSSIKSGTNDDLFDSWGKRKNSKKATLKLSKDAEKEKTDKKSKEKNENETEYDGHTTHLSVIDKDGNMVALTQTLGTFFGSYFMTQGVLFNSGMTNFSSTSGGINAPEPDKQPRSSIAPMLIFKNGAPAASLGSPGATRIVATVTQLVANLIDFKMNAEEANNAPRLFCQKADDYLHIEGRYTKEVIESLKKKGHNVRLYGDYDLFFGGAQIIFIDPATGGLTGSADIRRGGKAQGF